MSDPSPDAFQLRAAQGWLELGSWQEANEELEQLSPEARAHPDALKLRVEIYSAAERWEEAALVAEGLAKLIPDEPFPYVRAAFALHVLKRTGEAFNVLLPVADKFPDEWVIPYNIACYCSQLGRIEEAEDWFKLAMTKDEDEVKRAAIDDPDLVPLWESKRFTKWKRL